MASAISTCFGIIVCLGIIRLIQRRRWGRCRSRKSMKGKTVIITGANSGIGKEAAMELAMRDARVILACRNMDAASQAVEYIRKVTKNGELVIKKLDLASFDSVRSFAEDVVKTEAQLDILINNAGVYKTPFMTTKEGFEMQFGVNHLGHFLLTNLLTDKLKASAPSRVIIVASAYYKRGKIEFDNLNGEKEYNKLAAYKNSKLANVCFANRLSGLLKGTGVDVVSICPGIVWTNLGRYAKLPLWKMVLLSPLMLIFVRTANEGAQTVVSCAVDDDIVSGSMYVNCKKAKIDPAALDENVGKHLWDVSMQFAKLKLA